MAYSIFYIDEAKWHIDYVLYYIYWIHYLSRVLRLVVLHGTLADASHKYWMITDHKTCGGKYTCCPSIFLSTHCVPESSHRVPESSARVPESSAVYQNPPPCTGILAQNFSAEDSGTRRRIPVHEMYQNHPIEVYIYECIICFW